MKSALITGIVISLFTISAFATQPVKTDAIEPFFTLVAKTNDGGVRPDYLNFLRQHLARIGIDVDVVVTDWPTFVGELLTYRDFDICYVGLNGGGADPDFTGVYDENGSLNLFGYHTDMDFDENLGTGVNEWYMREGTLIMPPDSEERIQHYWDWEQYMMDKINPLLPTFAPKNYVAQWENLEGYNFTDGIIQSWGKLNWDGSHTGQISTDEIVRTDAAWSDLNPLFQDDTSSSFISNAVLDPMIWYDADLSAWPHLAESYTYVNDTTVELVVRDGINWQDDPDGLFSGETLDVEDFYFTIFAWKYLSNDQHLWNWIKDMEIVDDMTMRIYIDADTETIGNQAYAPSLPSFSTNVLPEHYLNQTQEADGTTPDVLHPSWNTFATNAFGTGLFEISDFTEGVETILSVFDDCWWLDTAITSDLALNWVERFGDFANSPSNLRTRIIPDLQTSLLEFEAGKVDYVGITPFPEKRDAYTLNPDFSIQEDTVYAYGFYGYNMREVRPEMGNREMSELDPTISKGLALRKAISYAVDRNEINEVIHRGEYVVTDWPIYPKMGIWCNPNIIRYNHDLDKARQYMAYAGYGDWTSEGPGFTLWIGIGSILMVATAASIILKRKK